MELFQREHIRRNKNELLRLTNCSVSFVAHLESKGVLDEYDKESLRAIEHRIEKVAKFYDIVVNKANAYYVVRDAFKETLQTGAEYIFNQLESTPVASPLSSALLVALPDLESRTRKRIRYEVRSPVHLFTGREAEIVQLHEYMTSQEHQTGSRTIVTQTASVTGLGGIGKTEVCRRYIQIYSEYYDGNAIWIQAEREEDMNREFKIVAKDHLKITLEDVDGSEKNIKTVVDEVYEYFEGKNVLFVFDNATSSDDEHLDNFMPTRVTTKPSILITSRDREWSEMPSKILTIGELKKEDAIAFVKKGLAIANTTQDEIINSLVKRLQYFPLAIHQAVSFIKQRGTLRSFEIKEYLSTFDKNAKQFLNAKIGKLANNKYSETTYTTWKITTNLIASEEEFGELSIQLLNMMAYFEPEKIRIELFPNCIRLQNKSAFEIDSALQLLIRYGMINSQPDYQMLSIHRLVQEVTRNDLKNEDKEEQVLRDCLSFFVLKVDLEEVGHVKSVLKLSSAFPLIIREFSIVPFNVGSTLIDYGAAGKEYPEFCKKWHGILTNYLSPNGTAPIVRMEYLLALHLREEKKYEECLEAFYQVTAKLTSLQDPERDVNLLWHINISIAKTLQNLHRIDESLELIKTMFMGQWGRPKNVQELVETVVLAFINYLEMGNFEGALIWCNTCIHKFYPDEPLPTFQDLHDLFNGLNEKEKTYCCLNEIGKRLIQLCEIDIIWIIAGTNFSFFLLAEGHYGDSLELINTLYELSKRKGESNLHTASLLTIIATLKVYTKEYAEAVVIFKNPDVEQVFAYKLHQKNKSLILLAYAEALMETRAYEEALQILNQLLGSFTDIHGQNHKSVVNTLLKIACVYEKMDNLGEALKLLLDAEKIEEKLNVVDRNEQSKAPKSRLQIAILNVRMEKYEEAVSTFRKVLHQIHNNKFGIGENTVGNYFVLALKKTGATEEALEVLNQMLVAYTKTHGREHKYVVETLYGLAATKVTMNKLEESLENLLEAQIIAGKLQDVEAKLIKDIRNAICIVTAILNNLKLV